MGAGLSGTTVSLIGADLVAARPLASYPVDNMDRPSQFHRTLAVLLWQAEHALLREG